MGVVIVAVGWYFIMNPNKGVDVSDNSAVSTSTEQKVDNKSEENKAAFAELIKKGGSLKCAVTESVNGNNVSGILYLNNGMVRGEYSFKIQNMNIDSTFILRDGFTYNWSSAAPTGYKVAVPKVDASAPPVNSNTFGVNNVSDYKCDTWTAEASKFAVPANITFVTPKTK